MTASRHARDQANRPEPGPQAGSGLRQSPLMPGFGGPDPLQLQGFGPPGPVAAVVALACATALAATAGWILILCNDNVRFDPRFYLLAIPFGVWFYQLCQGRLSVLKTLRPALVLWMLAGAGAPYVAVFHAPWVNPQSLATHDPLVPIVCELLSVVSAIGAAVALRRTNLPGGSAHHVLDPAHDRSTSHASLAVFRSSPFQVALALPWLALVLATVFDSAAGTSSANPGCMDIPMALWGIPVALASTVTLAVGARQALKVGSSRVLVWSLGAIPLASAGVSLLPLAGPCGPGGELALGLVSGAAILTAIATFASFKVIGRLRVTGRA